MATPIISRRILVCADDLYRPPLPRLGDLLSQGAISGALGGLVIALAKAVPMNGGRTMLVLALPFYMGWIAIHGLVAGFVVWGFTRAFSRYFGGIARIAIVASSFCAIYLGLSFLLPQYVPSPQEYLTFFGIFPAVITAALIGLVTGSSWRPGHLFSRGLWRVKPRQPLLETIAASVIRTIVLFGLLDSILLISCLLDLQYQFPDGSHDFSFAIIAFLYFLFASGIVLANPKLWLTTILVLLLNSPLVFVLVKYPYESGLWHFIITYLSLWGAFLLSQLRVLYKAFSVIKEELRYYLID